MSALSEGRRPPVDRSEGARFDGYDALAAYARAADCTPPDYAAFDRATVSHINLFSMRDNFDFARLSRILDEMLRALPALRRVFAKPIIHLKDEQEILPVESVRVVNNRSILHASAHSELWEDITEAGSVRPRRLLTVTNQDEYALYENIGFTRLILQTVAFLRHHIRTVREFLYADDILSRNLLERGSHLYYVLAVGKLRTGYMRGMEAYRDTAQRCLARMEYLYDALTSRMDCPLIRQCSRYAGRFVLHRSNLFRMHRDYHCVYSLLCFCAENGIGTETVSGDADGLSAEGYFAFCEALSLFAAGHFSFAPDPPEQAIRFCDMDIRLTFGAWSLRLTVVQGEPPADGVTPRGILIEVRRDLTYRILLLPTVRQSVRDGEDPAGAFRSVCPADEYLPTDPFGTAGRLMLSLTDIESFRRVQQLLLRAMVYASEPEAGDDADCPFCGHPLGALRVTADGWVRDCPACRTRIARRRCPVTGLAYRTTGICPPEGRIPVRRTAVQTVPERGGDTWRADAERRMNFRNITRLSPDGSPVCPRCGQIHSPPAPCGG